MVTPVQSLMNMEMELYGGYGTNMNAPSYMNNYMGGFYNYNSPASYYNYGDIWSAAASNYNPTFGQSIPAGYTNQAAQQQEAAFQGLSEAERQALIEDYKKSLTPSEGFLACAATNAAFGLAMNPRILVHPINTFNATFLSENATNKFFNTIKNDPKFVKLWRNPENNEILREAWLQHNKAVARCEGKFGAFRRGYGAQGNTKQVEAVKKVVANLEAALKKGDMNAITKHTAELKYVYGANDGFLGRGWNTVKGWFGGESAKNAGARLAEIEAAGKAGKVAEVEKIITDLNVTKKTGFGNILKQGGGFKGGLFFMGIEFAMSWGKIRTAFEKDSETGWKQLGQTTVKAAGNAAGWAVGEAAGKWAFAKIGAKLGSKVHPLFGTLIGGAVGLIGGGLGMWLAGKGTNKLVGQDVADDLEAKKLASTQEGQVQLLQNTMQRMQAGEKVSLEAQQTVQKLMA